jgi:hypothetical protein
MAAFRPAQWPANGPCRVRAFAAPFTARGEAPKCSDQLAWLSGDCRQPNQARRSPTGAPGKTKTVVAKFRKLASTDRGVALLPSPTRPSPSPEPAAVMSRGSLGPRSASSLDLRYAGIMSDSACRRARAECRRHLKLTLSGSRLPSEGQLSVPLTEHVTNWERPRFGPRSMS